MMVQKIKYTFVVIGVITGLFWGKRLYAQQSNPVVSGTVTDAQTGESLSGVNILVKGTNNGTSSNKKGNYKLNVSANAELKFSYIGYETKSINVDGRSTINVTLKPTAVAGKEMIVTGYGEEEEANLSGSVGSVTSSQFEAQPVVNTSQALEGKVAGVQVTQTNGQPGTSFKIRVRGSNSITGNNDPLYVVDGMQVKNITDLNAKDIASMKILKDADATALYGSRGSNGVVVITTRSGSYNQKAHVEFNGSVGFQNVHRKLNQLSPVQFARVTNRRNKSLGNNPAFSKQKVEELENGGGTNWQDLIFRENTPIQNYNLNFSGGEDKINYNISGGMVRNKGFVYQSQYERYSIRSNVNFKTSDKFHVKFHLYGARRNTTGDVASLNSALNFDPTVNSPIKDAQGNYLQKSPYATTAGNSYLNSYMTKKKNNHTNIRTSVKGTYDFTDALSLHVFGGLHNLDQTYGRYLSRKISAGKANISDNHQIGWQTTGRLSYKKVINEDNRLEAQFVYEHQYTRYTNSSISAQGFPTDASKYHKVGLASDQKNQSGFTSEKLRSFIGRLHYVFRDKYILTGTARADGSSKFRKGNRYGIFPSGSVGWKLGQYPFIQDIEAITQLKLRASYGITGSQAVDPLQTRAKLQTDLHYAYPLDPNQWHTGIQPSLQGANPDLSWETTRQLDIGLDMKFLDSRISVSADVYNKLTHDLLLNQTTPIYTGVTSILRNVGEVRNRGFELSFNSTPVSKRNIQFDAGFNISVNRNKIISLGGPDEIYAADEYNYSVVNGQKATVQKVGQSLGSFRGYVWQGVYQEKQKDEADKFNKQPGDYGYKDINADGKIDGEDITTIGAYQPDLNYGMNLGLNFWSFDFSMYIKGSYGGQVYNLSKAGRYGFNPQIRQPISSDALHQWSPDHPNGTYIQYKSSSDPKSLSSQFLENGSYLKITNIALGYSLAPEIVSPISIQSLRIYVSAQNALTFTPYDGFDPEISSASSSDTDVAPGVDVTPYPIARTLTFGVDVRF